MSTNLMRIRKQKKRKALLARICVFCCFAAAIPYPSDGQANEASKIGRDSSANWRSYPIFEGEITSIAVDPASPLTVYAGTRDAGVFKSTDGGDTWNPARTGLSFYPIRSLAINPDAPTTLLAGTDFDGVWRSTDNGASWSKSSTGLYEGLVIFDLVLDPNNTNTVFAGLAGGLGLFIGNIYRSTDFGLTWSVSDAGLPHTGDRTNGISALAIDPSNSLNVYAGTVYDGAFASADGGATWTEINEGLPGDEPYMETVDALATNPHDGNRLCAVIQGGLEAGFYCRSDLGEWTKISSEHELFGGGSLYFHPTDSSIVLTAGGVISGECKISHDGGVTWGKSLGHPESGTISDIRFHPSTPAVIYAAGDLAMSSLVGGVYRSFDTGATWSLSTQGVTASVIRSVAIDPSNTNRLYAGTSDGLLFSHDGGLSWNLAYRSDISSNDLGPANDIALDPTDSQHLYVSGPILFRSGDGGASFTGVFEVKNANCLTITPTGTLYVGTGSGQGIYKGSDSGGWTQVNTGLPIAPGQDDPCPVSEITVDPNAPDTVWAGTWWHGGIVRTQNGGASWEVMGLTEENLVEAIAVHPHDSSQILAGAGWFDGAIYKSTDGGLTWKKKIDEIALVTDLMYLPADPRYVYATTEGMGVLRSTDGGETWSQFSDGIFYPLLYSIAVSADNPALLITGSYGSGLYWTTHAPQQRVLRPSGRRQP